MPLDYFQNKITELSRSLEDCAKYYELREVKTELHNLRQDIRALQEELKELKEKFKLL